MDGCRECGVVGSHLFDCPERIAELERELAEARQGILECQARMLALERDLADVQGAHGLNEKVLRYDREIGQLKQDRDEAHAAIRDANKLLVKKYDFWREKHAPVIRRAMGQ